MEVKLRVLEGTNAGQEILLPVKTFMIGRAEECHLRPQSDLISRHQCAIIAEDSQVFVRDIGSKNGTFVNNERIRGEHPVKNGDRLRVGPLEFEIVLSTSVGGAKRPPVRDLKEAVARVAQSGPSGSLPVDQWLGDTAPAASPSAAPAAHSSSDTGHHASGDTGRVSPAVTIPGGIAAVAGQAAVSTSTAVVMPSVEPVLEVSSATVPISASSSDTIAIRPVAPLAPLPTPAPLAQAPISQSIVAPAPVEVAPVAVAPVATAPVVADPVAAAPAAPAKPAASVYGAAPVAAPPAEAAPVPVQKPRHSPSVYVPPPPEPKVEAEAPSKEVPPPHGKMQKPGTANSRDAAADTLKRLFGRR